MIIEHYYSPKFVEVSELLRKKLKEGRVVLVQKVSDAFCCLIFVLKVKVFIKNGKIFGNIGTFEKVLFRYKSIKGLH